MRFLIAPSLLASDIGHLADEIKRVEDGGADLLHVDIMDGHFVPNLTFGPVVVEHIKKNATLPLDVHLMLDEPERYAKSFRDAGADSLIFHPETVQNPRRFLNEIRAMGARRGVSLRPDTPVELIHPYLDAIDMVMVMTVHPGFGGQELIPECLMKITELRERAGVELDIEVDGGINDDTIADVARHGANVIVAGTGVFRVPDPKEAIDRLRNACLEHSPYV